MRRSTNRRRDGLSPIMLALPWVASAVLIGCAPPPPAPILELPGFELIDQRDLPFGSAELAERVYVVDFFFTRCGSICPLLTGAMLRLQQRFDDADLDVRLVSISVDPEYDRPPVLATYAESYGIDTERWTLLTGERSAIGDLVENGFKSVVGDPTLGDNGLFDIAHSSKLFLVDGEGRVRGLYGIEDEELLRLERDAIRLVR